MIVLDIETYCDEDINDVKYIQKAKVKWVGMFIYETNQYYLMKETEHEEIQYLIKKYGDFIITFNGDYFDVPIMKRNGYQFPYSTYIDLREVVRKHNGIWGPKHNRLSLRHITEETFGESIKGDIDYMIFAKDEWTPEEEEEIKKYLNGDIEATKRLYEWLEKQGEPLKAFLSDYEVKKKKYLTWSTGSYSYAVICNLTGMRQSFGSDANGEHYKGGFVAEPAGERFVGNIYLLDFSSMYPHAYMQGNLFSNKCNCCSEEEKWKANDMFPELKGRYCSKKLGLIEQKVREIYIKRMEYKAAGDPREYALKIILNTMYGICGNPIYINLYNPTTAADCTYIGRRCVQYARKRLEENGYKIIYSDTDSVYLEDPFNDKQRMLNIKSKVIEELKASMNFPQPTFDMGIDGEPQAIFFVKRGERYLKKNYIYITQDNKIKTKGLKIIKNNCSKVSKTVYEKYIKPRILKDKIMIFPKAEIKQWIVDELEHDIGLAAIDFKVKRPDFYKNSSQLQYQIAVKYGAGVHALLPNKRIGVGKSRKYCTLEEAEAICLRPSQLSLNNFYKELEPFYRGSIGVSRGKKPKNRFQNSLEMWI